MTYKSFACFLFGGSALVGVLLISNSTASSVSPLQTPPNGMPASMTCSPANVTNSTIISITMPKGHGPDFAIETPSGVYHVMAIAWPTKDKRLHLPIPAKQFMATNTLTLSTTPTQAKDIAIAEGIPWDETTFTPSQIFLERGVYKAILGTALETDDPVIEGTCTFSYAP